MLSFSQTKTLFDTKHLLKKLIFAFSKQEVTVSKSEYNSSENSVPFLQGNAVRIIKISGNLTREFLCFISLIKIVWWNTQIIKFFYKNKYIYLKWEKCILLYFIYYVYFSENGKKIKTCQ